MSVCILSCSIDVQLFATLWTVAFQAPLSMGILQARILEWVGIPFSKGPSQPRNRIQVSNPSLLHLLHWQAGSWPVGSPGSPKDYIYIYIYMCVCVCVCVCVWSYYKSQYHKNACMLSVLWVPVVLLMILSKRYFAIFTWKFLNII